MADKTVTRKIPNEKVRVIIRSGVGVQGEHGEHLSSPTAEVHELDADFAQQLIGTGQAYVPDPKA